MQPASSQADTRIGSCGWVARAHTPPSPHSNDSSTHPSKEEDTSSSSHTPASPGKHSRAVTPTPSWVSHSCANDWQDQSHVRDSGMVRSKSCSEGQLGGESLALSGGRVRWGGFGSHATSSSGSGHEGRNTCGWGETDSLQRSPTGGYKPRHVRRNSADSGCSWRHTGKSAFGGGDGARRKWRPQKGQGKVSAWDDCPTRQDLFLAEKALSEETSQKLSLQSAVLMPKIECKLEEPQQGSAQCNGSAHSPDRSAVRRIPRKPSGSRNRTSRFIGVGASNRKNQWQARILVHGKVTHLGYYRSEEEAAMIYDRVAISLNSSAATNFPASRYAHSAHAEFAGLTREELQRALGVKPMDKSSVYKGVSRKKGKWEAKVMVNRKWAYRALFDSETEAARAYDSAVWRLKPREASSFVNFKSDGMRRKRSSDLSTSPLVRTKSQRRAEPALADAAPTPQGSANALTLDLAHIPQLPLQPELEHRASTGDLPDIAPPHVMDRCNSMQHPPRDGGSPERGVLLRATSSYPLPEVMPEFQANPLEQGMAAPPQQMFTLPAPGGLGGQMGQQQMLGVSQPFPCMPPLTSLPPLSAPPPTVLNLNLPDPNSIGVPPPDNVPFPELVRQPLVTNVPGEGLQSRRGSAHLSGGLEAPPPLGISRHSSMTPNPSGLPDIPPPLLPTACLLGLEGMSMMPTMDVRSQSSSPHPQQNPFLKASLLTQLPDQPPATMTRLGSDGSHQLPLYPQAPSLQKLPSMPESAIPGLHRSNTLQAIPRLPSADQCMLSSIVTHETQHNGQAFPTSGGLDLASGVAMMGTLPGQFQPNVCGQHQQSMPDVPAGGLPLMGSVGSPLEFPHLQVPKSIFEPQQAGSQGQCTVSGDFTQLHSLGGSAPGHACLPELGSVKSAHLPHSLSTPALLQMQGQHGSGCLQTPCPPQQPILHTPPLGLSDCDMLGDAPGVAAMDTDGNQHDCADALDILAELGVDTREPECPPMQSVQIGGDNLHTYDSAKTAGDSFLLGGGT